MKDRWSKSLWRQAMALALFLHAAIIAGFVWGPKLFRSRAAVPVPYTVRLFEPQVVSDSPRQREGGGSVTRKTSSGKSRPADKTRSVERPAPKKQAAAKKKPSVSAASKKAVSLHPGKEKKRQQRKKREKEVKKKKKDTKNRAKGSEKRLARKRKEDRSRARKGQDREKKVQQRIAELQKRLQEKEAERRLKERLAQIAARHSGNNRGAGRAGLGGSDDQQGSVYGNYVMAKVRRNWHFPSSLADRKDIEAVVSVTVAKDGRVLDIRVKKYSGNAAFDRSVVKAVRASMPFPPFPRAMRKDFEEIEIIFNLKE